MVAMDDGRGRGRDVESAGAKPEALEEAVSKVLADIKENLYRDPFANRWSVSIRADDGRISEVCTEVIRRLAGHPDFECETHHSTESTSLVISERKPGVRTVREASELTRSDFPTLKEIRESEGAMDGLKAEAQALCSLAQNIFKNTSRREWTYSIEDEALASALKPVIDGLIKTDNLPLVCDIRWDFMRAGFALSSEQGWYLYLHPKDPSPETLEKVNQHCRDLLNLLTRAVEQDPWREYWVVTKPVEESPEIRRLVIDQLRSRLIQPDGSLSAYDKEGKTVVVNCYDTPRQNWDLAERSDRYRYIKGDLAKHLPDITTIRATSAAQAKRLV